MSLTRSLAAVGASALVGAALLLGAAPAQAIPVPVQLSFEVAGPDGVFVPVASGGQFAVSSTSPTTARWTLTNPTSTTLTGYYLYGYGPDCLVSDLTIAAGATYVCTEVIAPEAQQPAPAYGVQSLGALGGFFDGSDYAVAYPLSIDIVEDTAGASFTLDKTTVAAEGTIVISGSGFDDDDVLTGIIASTPIDLGTFALTGGSFSRSVTLPAGFDPGAHTITLYSNGVAYAVRSFTLLAAPAPVVPAAVPELAASGASTADVGTPLALGSTLVLLGAALLVVRARRSAATEQ
jgi:hypothetical protein